MLAVNVSANTSDMCPITLYRHLDKKGVTSWGRGVTVPTFESLTPLDIVQGGSGTSPTVFVLRELVCGDQSRRFEPKHDHTLVYCLHSF